MSYFMVVSGGKPDLSETPGIALTPLSEEQEYIRKVINKHFPEFKESETWSVSDESRTMELVQKAYKEADLGINGAALIFVKLIMACASAGCKIFLWWTDAIEDDGFKKNLKRAPDIRGLHEIIVTQQGTDGNVCAYWQPWRPA